MDIQTLSTLPAVMDVDQVAALLHCTSIRVSELVERNELPGSKYGRTLMFETRQLLEFMRARALREIAEREELRRPKSDMALQVEARVDLNTPKPARGRGRPPSVSPFPRATS